MCNQSIFDKNDVNSNTVLERGTSNLHISTYPWFEALSILKLCSCAKSIHACISLRPFSAFLRACDCAHSSHNGSSSSHVLQNLVASVCLFS